VDASGILLPQSLPLSPEPKEGVNTRRLWLCALPPPLSAKLCAPSTANRERDRAPGPLLPSPRCAPPPRRRSGAGGVGTAGLAKRCCCCCCSMSASIMSPPLLLSGEIDVGGACVGEFGMRKSG